MSYLPFVLAMFWWERRDELLHVSGEDLSVGDKESIVSIDDDNILESGGDNKLLVPMDKAIFALKVDMLTTDDFTGEMALREEFVERVPASDVAPFEGARDDEALLPREPLSEDGIDREAVGAREYFSKSLIGE